MKLDLNELRKEYMEIGDPTEYQLAIKLFGSLKEWKKFVKDNLKEYIKEWREELELKIKSNALSRIISDTSFQASKFILEKGWELESTRGRPSKEEIKRNTQKIIDEQSQLNDDWKRIFKN